MKKVEVIQILALTMVLFVSGCQKDSTTTPSGDERAKFLGSWAASDTELKFYYDAIINADSSSANAVLISNFGGIGYSYPPAKARVLGNNITLNLDQVVGDGLILNGSGTFSGTSVIKWKYTLFDGATLKTVSSVYTKH